MDDRRIARALAGTDDELAEERARRRRQRWRVFFRIVAVTCLVLGAALTALLLRPLPTQAELQYTQGTIRQARMINATRSLRFPYYARFEIILDHEPGKFTIDTEAAARNGRSIADIAKPGATARIGYAAPAGRRAWDLAVDEREIYSLADIRARAARESPPYWFAAATLLAAGVIGWFLTPRPRRRSYRHRHA
jgi:hypothetical protein